MIEIFYEPEEVWSLFLSNRGNPNSEHLIAFNETYDVYMTPQLNKDYLEEELMPYIFVEKNDEKVWQEVAISKQDCIYTVNDAYSFIQEHDDDNGEDAGASIKERENELIKITEDFVAQVVNNDVDYELYVDEESIERLMNKFLAFIDKEGIPVYRPTMLKEKDGTMVYTEYPYRLLTEQQ